jgi:hypothetical protein
MANNLERKCSHVLLCYFEVTFREYVNFSRHIEQVCLFAYLFIYCSLQLTASWITTRERYYNRIGHNSLIIYELKHTSFLIVMFVIIYAHKNKQHQQYSKQLLLNIRYPLYIRAILLHFLQCNKHY